MNTIEEGFLTVLTFLEHLGYTDTKQITCIYLGNVWRAKEQIKMDKYILISVLLIFHKH